MAACDSSLAPETDPRLAAEVEPKDAQPPVETDATRSPVEVDGAGTACAPEWDRPEWLKRNFVNWVPDGSVVLFTDGPRIYAVTVDGSRLWQVVEPTPVGGRRAGLIAPFTISPDGEHVVYATCDLSEHYQLVRVRLDGTQPQRLSGSTMRFENHPAWSPDGRRIAYSAGFGRAPSDIAPLLYTMAPDGSEVTAVRMVPAAELLHRRPQWSPDSRYLAYVQREVGGRLGLYTVAPGAGTPPQRLSATVSSASWSPDGTRLAFAKPESEEDAVGLYTIAADGTDAQRVTTIAGWRPHFGAFGPTEAWIEIVAWSPDASKILYSCRGSCVVDLDDAPVREAPTAVEGSSAENDLHRSASSSTLLGPATLHVAGRLAAWSPDGSRIASVDTSASYFPDSNLRDVVVYTVAADGSDLRALVVRDAEGRLQSADDVRQAGVAPCAAGKAVPEPAANPDLVDDCEALLRARDALRGTADLNWTPNRPIGEWDGLHVGGWPRRLIAISLNGRGLAGKIPRELGELTHLRRLELSGNSLGGEIPPELGQLTQLARLDLADNSLRGRIPPELGALTNLVALQLNNNQLTGPIPVEVSQLVNLEVLFLGGNALTDCVPPGSLEIRRHDLSSLGLPACEPG